MNARRMVSLSLLASVPLLGMPFAPGDSPGADAAIDRGGEVASESTFATHIAPLLARHCLECHDAATRDGGLDLSRRDAALLGGDSGAVIVAGDSAQSLLWEHVESDVMPQDRPPLSPEQKRQLREWIDKGAEWTIEVIDPADYTAASGTAIPWVQRLTNVEYVATVRAATGVDIEREAADWLPRDVRTDGFTNTAYNLGVDLPHIEAYARLAALIVRRMNVPEFVLEHAPGQATSRLLDSRELVVQADDLRRVIDAIGRWLLRGPLEEHETDAYLKVAAVVSNEGGGSEEALAYVIEAMLQSPRFIYRIERQRGEGAILPLTDHELASRLSYILWGAPPDRELLQAADAGGLQTHEQLASQVQRMLKDPRAVTRSLQFVHDWLDLGRLANLRPDPERFPGWSTPLAAEMRAETLAYFEEIVWKQRRPLCELMNAQVTFVTRRLAEHYGLDTDTDRELQLSRRTDVPMVRPSRVTAGLQVLYTFDEGGGDVVRDVSGSTDPLNLRIGDPSAVHWTETGLEIARPTIITAGDPPVRLFDAVRAAHAVTIEAWITPANATQEGPARIVTLSSGVLARNFTLGQQRDQFDVRFRTTTTNPSGQPSLPSAPGAAGPAPTHVVYTRATDGRAAVYVNGSVSAQSQVDGDLSSWDRSFQIALGNELSGDRPWLGTLHLVALYDRALSADEVQRNRAAGARADGPAALAGHNGLQALYTFDAGDGDLVRDESGVESPLDLTISDSSAVSWTPDGLRVNRPVGIATAGAAQRLNAAIRASRAFTIDAWITPAKRGLTGPARIVSLSETTSRRNFTLGQEGDCYDVRCRSSSSDRNGLPSLSSPAATLQPGLTRLVYTRSAEGFARLFVDGEEVAGADGGGDLSNWEEGFPLVLANETTGDRPWIGTFHRLAIYSRALSEDELGHSAGPGRYDLTRVPERGGLLTQGSLLTIGGDEASTVTRGLFVLFDFLYGQVGSPPACVDTTPVPPAPGQSRRAVAETRLANPACGGCHAKFEPFAFGLEKFDGLGAFHERDEHGNVLREDGEILIPGQSRPMAYANTGELMDLLAGSDRVRMCLTRKVAQFALGRPLSPADAPILDTIHAQAQADGGTYEALITAIVLSDLVRTNRAAASE